MAVQTHNTGDLLSELKVVSKAKGIELDRLIETVEDAIVKAAQSVFHGERVFRAELNRNTGQIDLFQCMTVVDDPSDDYTEIDIEDARRYVGEDPENPIELGEMLDFQIFWHPRDVKKAAEQDKEFGDLLRVKQARSAFGRIAAQTAKQVLIQRVRDEEKELIFNEFGAKKGQLVRGRVTRLEKQNIIVELDRIQHGGDREERARCEAVLPFREQVPRETYRPNDSITVILKEIDREARGQQIILSRADAKLVERLFEAEVPEIFEGIVKVVACAREPGARTKIAVASRDADVDPIGACVGMKGARVQAVIQELRGEKIDIVVFDRDPARFVCEAVKPAEVNKVIVNQADGRMELVVSDEKLSLAIGRKGQNVRLAAQLTGWKLDIISESKFRQMEEEAVASLKLLQGVDETLARSMYREGFRTLEEVIEASEEELTAIPGLGDSAFAEQIRVDAEEVLERVRQARFDAALAKGKAVTEREKMFLIRGMSERVVELFEEAGYKSLIDIDEEDEDRLQAKIGLGMKKIRAIKASLAHFFEKEAHLFS